MASHVPNVSMREFHYDLPDELIARYPAEPRGTSRLLVVAPSQNASPLCQSVREEIKADGGMYFDRIFNELPHILPSNTHLVFNDSRVFAARLFAVNDNGKALEVMFLAPEQPYIDPSVSLSSSASSQIWRCMVRRTFDSPGVVLPLFHPTISALAPALQNVSLKVVTLHEVWHEEGEDPGQEASVQFVVEATSVPLSDVFTAYGEIPLPPYMRRSADAKDVVAYQTVYASETITGSVAAPTAGLHFTDAIIEALGAKGLTTSKFELHVSAGTFKPVTVPTIGEHEMHQERFEATRASLLDLVSRLREGRQVVVVGTTSVRLLETLYWLGVKAKASPPGTPLSLELSQWEPYALAERLGSSLPFSAADALEALCNTTTSPVLRGATSLCIVPGYKFAVPDGLITNFHQPDSTLLLLVAALLGSHDELSKAYAHALDKKYRFLSYGDACLFFK